MLQTMADKLNKVYFGGWRTSLTKLADSHGDTVIPDHHCTYEYVQDMSPILLSRVGT